MDKIHSLGQLAYVPIRFIEMEFVGQIGSPIQIPTDQLVILWVYLSLGALRKKDEKTQWENYLTRWGIRQYPNKALGR